MELLQRNITVRNFVAIICYLSQVNMEAQCQEAVDLFKGKYNLIFGPERMFLIVTDD